MGPGKLGGGEEWCGGGDGGGVGGWVEEVEAGA